MAKLGAYNKRISISKLLKRLLEIGDVEAAAIITRDGLLIASEMIKPVDSEIFAAMNATLFGAAETAMAELGRGLLDRVIVEGRDAKLVAVSAGENALLVLLTENKANIGLVLIGLEKLLPILEKELNYIG
jgi:predicted regulator of Ras-like GTPase activity (Roadblock/LC7/MglB family)